MKKMMLCLVAMSLLLCLFGCAEKKTETTAAPTAETEAPALLPDGDKTAVDDFQNPIRENPDEEKTEIESEPLPTLTMPEIPDPEPVEPDTESASS